MGLPVILRLNGAILIEPAVPGPGASLVDALQLAVLRSYGASKSARPTINSTDGSPYEIPLDGMTKVRFLAIVTGVPMKLLLTTPAGTNQAIPFAGTFVLDTPNVGQEITAAKLVGAGGVQYLVAGDP